MIETRGQIRQHLRSFAAFWDDTRLSQDVAPGLGISGIQIFESTPQSMQAARVSREKAQVMGHLVEAFGLVNMTRPFRGALIGAISAAYDTGLNSNYALAGLAVNLERDDLGVLEQDRMQENEGAYLATTIKEDSLHFIGRLGFMIPEEVEAQMTHVDAARSLRDLLKHPVYGWAPAEAVEKSLDQLYSGRFRQLREDALIRFVPTLDWADIYQSTYQDDAFSQSADFLRPVVRIYILGEEPGQRNPTGLELT